MRFENGQLIDKLAMKTLSGGRVHTVPLLDIIINTVINVNWDGNSNGKTMLHRVCYQASENKADSKFKGKRTKQQWPEAIDESMY